MFAVVHIKCSHSARQLLRDDVSFYYSVMLKSFTNIERIKGKYVTQTFSNSKRCGFTRLKSFTVVKKTHCFYSVFLFFQYVNFFFFFVMQFSFFRKFPCYVKGYISQSLLLTFKFIFSLIMIPDVLLVVIPKTCCKHCVSVRI